MTFATTYSYSNREISDLRTLLDVIRFILVNFILALIIIFLILEEFEWAIFSSNERFTDEITDETTWNIKKLI